MNEMGYQRNAAQCRTKMDNVKTDYKKVKESSNETIRDRKTFPSFETLDKVVGENPTISLRQNWQQLEEE